MSPHSSKTTPPDLGLIAGRGEYPELVVHEARKAGVKRLVIVGIEGDTDPALLKKVDASCLVNVGQLGKLISFFKKEKVPTAMMAGQVAPKQLFDLRPDLKAIFVLARLKRRNAETIFGAIAEELEKIGVNLLPATTYLEDHLATVGLIAGPKASRSLLRDISFGWPIAKQISALDIGQTIVVRQGTVLAVEGFDGTDATIRRGGELGKGKAVMLKVSKPQQDLRFDVPVIGPHTLEVAAESGIQAIVCEAKKTLLLGRENLMQQAAQHHISIFGHEEFHE